MDQIKRWDRDHRVRISITAMEAPQKNDSRATKYQDTDQGHGQTFIVQRACGQVSL